MFTQPNGKPVDPRRDQYEWKALLAEAGVREARLHDARHTAATTLLLLGVRERAVMDVMGWSNAAMVKRYAHVTARLRRDIADRLNTYFWSANETNNETEPGSGRPDSESSQALCLLRTSGQGQGRTADLPLFRRTLIPTELPDRAGVTPVCAVLTGFEPATSTLTGWRALLAALQDHVYRPPTRRAVPPTGFEPVPPP